MHPDHLPAPAVNTAFKAGNIRDFCERWGGNHDFAVTLDADSYMPAETVLRLVRIAQAIRRSAFCRRWSSACRR